MQIDVRIEGLERLQAGVASGPATLATATRTAMTAGSLLIEGAARTLAPKDTGRLAGSITHSITGGGANLTSKIGPSVNYGYWVEHGRGPGGIPPVTMRALAGWAARHGGMNPYMLAKRIAERGTKKQPFMKPAFEGNRAKVVSLFERIGVAVVQRMAGG